MKKIFSDTNLNSKINEDGYVVFNHNNSTIANRVNSIFKKYLPEANFNHFHTTHFSENIQYKKDVLNLAHTVFKESFEKEFADYQVIFANLMVKYSGGNGVVPTHADWTYIDETHQSAISIWIPITDTKNRNDALGVIPSSHHQYDRHRGPNIVSPYRIYDSYIMENYGQTLSISPLQAVIYDLRLLHFSRENNSGDTRIAINIVLVPKDMEVIHYNQVGDFVYLFKNLDSDFFLNYHAHQIPSQAIPSEIIHDPNLLADDDIRATYKINEPSFMDEKQTFWKKFKRLLGKKV